MFEIRDLSLLVLLPLGSLLNLAQRRVIVKRRTQTCFPYAQFCVGCVQCAGIWRARLLRFGGHERGFQVAQALLEHRDPSLSIGHVLDGLQFALGPFLVRKKQRFRRGDVAQSLLLGLE